MRAGLALLPALLMVCACGTEVDRANDGGPRPDAPAGGGPDAATPPPDAGPDAAALVDDDGDGIDDAREATLAAAYLPYLSVDPADGCPLGGIVYRLRPHPADATLLLIVYDHLFENDCGFTGHVGDNEAFGVTIDPAVPGPAGVVAMIAISHQATACQRISECGRCGGQSACTTAAVGGEDWPVVFSSKDKHGGYVSESSCDGWCLDQCLVAPAPDVPPLVNAGEPGLPLCNDLTACGFITAANGWTEASLMGFDPWGMADFGSAGNVADDLVDPAFEAAACP